MNKPWYQQNYSRIIVDMHIPDWNEKFLSKYDPVRMAELYERAGITSAVVYCQSAVGLCYWPTKSGRMHAGLCGRDLVSETLQQLRLRRIAACAYYIVIYNNWAFLEHPEWRIKPAGDGTDGSFVGHRYGHCCPNNSGYREFVLLQVKEILEEYNFDGFFFDMTFWPSICLCESCRALYLAETGKEIPQTINWLSPDWCQFHASRERWIMEFAGILTAKVKELRPNVSVHHNFATALFNWTLGLSLDSSVHSDFLSADFYGDALEQLVASKLMRKLTKNRPVEFMTSFCKNLRDHVRLKNPEMLEIQAFAATFFSSAFLWIDAINIDGTAANPAIYEEIEKICAKTAVYEPYLGGEEVVNIAVYFSSESKMDFDENGQALAYANMWSNKYPHINALYGVCQNLQQAHLPFGIITRKQLDELGQYKLVVLPNVLFMDKTEVQAFREYVNKGGKIYASCYTSLTETGGMRHPDFMLADVFGCHFLADDLGLITYLKPVDAEIAACVAPQKYLSNFSLAGQVAGVKDTNVGMLRLRSDFDGKTLATLTLPYASPAMGTVFDQKWASINSSPPWEDTNFPVIVKHKYGKGDSVYTAATIECIESKAHDSLFLCLIHMLMDDTPTFTAEAHPSVWMTVFHEPEKNRYLLKFLNYQSQLPVIPIPDIRFTLKCPAGKKFAKLFLVPEGLSMPFTTDGEGRLQGEINDLVVFKMLVAEYTLSK